MGTSSRKMESVESWSWRMISGCSMSACSKLYAGGLEPQSLEINRNGV